MSVNLESNKNGIDVNAEFKRLYLVDEIQKTNEIKGQQGVLTDIFNKYNINQSYGIYNYFNNIRREYLLLYFLLLLVFYNFIDNINFTTKNIISLVMTVSIIYYINDMNEKTSIDDLKLLEIKLLSIYPQPEFFHIDGDIIELIFSIKEFRDYSTEIYDKIIDEIDTFLKLSELIKTEADCNKLYDIMIDLKKRILNNLHSMILVLPMYDNISLIKLKDAIGVLHVLLNIHLQNSRNNCNDKIVGNETSITAYIREIKEEPYSTYDVNYDVY